MSSNHFTADGTLIEAWASMKSFMPKTEDSADKPRPGDPLACPNGEVNSTANGAPTRRMRYALMENRNGLIVESFVTRAEGSAERCAALAMIERFTGRPNRITLGADKGYDTRDIVNEARTMNVAPHVAQTLSGRRSAIDRHVTRHAGYAASQRIRKRIEGLRLGRGDRDAPDRVRGLPRVGLTALVYDLVRLAKLPAA